jgi:hypothetical protein
MKRVIDSSPAAASTLLAVSSPTPLESPPYVKALAVTCICGYIWLTLPPWPRVVVRETIGLCAWMQCVQAVSTEGKGALAVPCYWHVSRV